MHKQQADDTLSEQDKTRLLEYLRKVHGATEAKSKITLMRKQTSEIKKSDSTGKSRTIQVEVKKKRVFVKRDAPGKRPAPVAVAEAPLGGADRRRSRSGTARAGAEAPGGAAGAPGGGTGGEAGAREGCEAREARGEAACGREAARAATQAAAAEAQPAATDGTLHKPKVAEAAEGRRRARRRRRHHLAGRDREAAHDQDPRRRRRRLRLAHAQRRRGTSRASTESAKQVRRADRAGGARNPWSRKPSPSPISRTRCR